MSLFIKFLPTNPEFIELMEYAGKNAYVLLSVIASRVRRSDSNDMKKGEAIIGDMTNYGLSKQETRTAMDKLIGLGHIVKVDVITSGFLRGTKVKLISKSIFDLNLENSNENSKTYANIVASNTQATRRTQKTKQHAKQHAEQHAEKTVKNVGIIDVEANQKNKDNTQNNTQDNKQGTPQTNSKDTDCNMFLIEFEQITGKNFVLTQKIEDLYKEANAKYTQKQLLDLVRSMAKSTFHQKPENSHILTPAWLLKSETLEKFQKQISSTTSSTVYKVDINKSKINKEIGRIIHERKNNK